MGDKPESSQPETEASTEATNDKPSTSEPIDTDFEPVEHEADNVSQDIAATTEKTGPGWGALLTTGAFASIIGAAIAMVATGSSGVDTAKFAPAEISGRIAIVENVQSDLNERVQKVLGTVSEIEARQLRSGEEVLTALTEQTKTDELLRAQIELLTTELELLVSPEVGEEITSSENTDTESTTDVETSNAPTQSPLQKLFARIETLEQQLASRPDTTSNQDATQLDTPPAQTELASTLGDLKSRLAALEDANTQYADASETRKKAINALKVNLGQTQTGLSDVQADLASLKSELAKKPDAAAIRQSLSESPAGVMGKASLALSQLEANAQRGKPFSAAWENLNRALPQNENVQAIKSIARRGASSFEMLETSFHDMEEVLNDRANATEKNDGWDWARKAFGGVVSVKKTDGSDVDNTGRLHNIAKALSSNQLGEAITQARELNGPIAIEIEQWLEDAERRFALDENIEAIRATILTGSHPGLSSDIIPENSVSAPVSNETTSTETETNASPNADKGGSQ